MANVMVPPEEITKKANEVMARAIASNAIAIQDLIKRLNGPGLKNINLFLLLQITKDLPKPHLLTKALKSTSIMNMILLLSLILIIVVISELNRKTCSHILARAT